jgi:hypothetical protein
MTFYIFRFKILFCFLVDVLSVNFQLEFHRGNLSGGRKDGLLPSVRLSSEPFLASFYAIRYLS